LKINNKRNNINNKYSLYLSNVNIIVNINIKYAMRNSVTFTSSISPELISLLNDYSKKLKTPKSRLISLAVENYINELKKEEYTKSFQKAKNDNEIRTLTEDGIDDFLEILDK
jgi:hypothetical protein